jgi:tellurite resistance protein TerC
MALLYIGFIAFILLLLALDLGVFHRKAHVVSVREALGWSVIWISLGLAFTVFVYFGYEHHWLGLGTGAEANDGASAATKYLTGFVLEKSLAVDNIFVIAMIFAFVRVPPMYQHRVLFWGIVGALLMRGVMIGVGAALIAQFSWILYVFGGLLIVMGAKMLFAKDAADDFGKSFLVRTIRRVLPVTEQPDGAKFFVRAPRGTRIALVATPLFLALVLVELADVIFAIDSIPAIFAITTDAFLVFTSNVFAILGLRSLYFALAGMIDRFKYLKVSLSIVLVLIGVKMLAHDWLKEMLGASFNFYVLGVVASILAAGVAGSLLATRSAKGISPQWNG